MWNRGSTSCSALWALCAAQDVLVALSGIHNFIQHHRFGYSVNLYHVHRPFDAVLRFVRRRSEHKHVRHDGFQHVMRRLLDIPQMGELLLRQEQGAVLDLPMGLEE